MPQPKSQESAQQTELLPQGWLQSLKAKHNEAEPNGLIPEATTAETVSDVADATIAILQMFRVPVELLPFALAVIAAASGETEWFSCPDRVLGERALSDDTRSPEAKKKWVQRRRGEWIEWQTATSFVLIECAPGGMVKDVRHESRYRAHLLAFVRDCVALVRATGGHNDNRENSFKSAALKVLPDAMKKLAKAQARHERFNRPRQDAEARINRNLKTALSYLKKAVETVRNSGGDPSAVLEAHEREVKALLQNESKSVHIKTKEYSGHDDTGGARGAGSPEILKNAAEAMDKFVPPSPLHAATQAIEIFESVDTENFHVILRDEQTEAATGELVDGHALRQNLAGCLERNAAGRESFIIRPASKRRMIQVDECSPEVLKILAPVSFFQIETSEGNGQAFLALDGSFDEDAYLALRDRLLRRLKPLGANGGAYGALRWPGSLNCKPTRRRADGTFPRVRILHAALGKLTTLAELEAHNLLAPVSSPKPPPPVCAGGG
jgi:hypothetical protein